MFDRSQLGVWGIELDNEDFAQALAAAGLSASSDIILPSSSDPRGGTVYSWALPKTPSRATLPATYFREVWREIRRTSTSPIRLQIEHEPPDASLVSILTGPGAADAVYFRRDDPPAAVAWEWPLRVGLFDDARAEVLRGALSNSSMRQLVDFVTLTPTATRCDLLLLPYNLRTSLQRVLGASFRVQADCVIVMGGAKVTEDRIAPLFNALRTEVVTAGVALASVPKPQRHQWFHALVAALSHDHTIDVALADAARKNSLGAPVVVCSETLARFARISHFVARMGRELQSRRESPSLTISGHTASRLFPEMPHMFTPSAFEAGIILTTRAHDYRYDHESDEARAIVDLRADVHEQLGQPVTVRSIPAAAAVLRRAIPPAVPTRSLERLLVEKPEERRVQARFYEVVGEEREAERVNPETAYLLRVRIAPPNAGWITASEAFDESSLPPSATGHELSVAFIELRDGERGPITPPQQQRIHLPPQGASTEAQFRAQTAAKGIFIARVIVLYENRVLQTWILRAPLGMPATEAAFTEENVIDGTFQSLDQKRRFDAAIIVNDNAGVSGVTVSAENSISFLEPAGLPNVLKAIQKTVSGMTSLADSDFTLDDPDVVKLLITLASHGKLLFDLISAKLPNALSESAARIQVVEARDGAFLPVEYFYASYAPADDAVICPHGRQALKEATFGPCPNSTDPQFVCPTVFWGFSRVIERRPHQDFDNRNDYKLSEPQKDRSRLDPWKSAVVGASRRVAPGDINGADGILTSLKKVVATASHATDWAGWKTEISATDPTLLLLLPHTDEDSGIARMEIGNTPLKVSMIEEPYVRQPTREPGPIVLLLGCSTELTSIGFHNFVARFKIKGAALVLGTLSVIRGRHATRFVERFMKALSRWSGVRDATFGDALLETKRAMLADGDPFAVTLIAYGDADWRL